MTHARRDGDACAIAAGADGMGAIRQQEWGADFAGGGQDLPQQAMGFDGWDRTGCAVSVPVIATASIAPRSLLSLIAFSV